MSSTLPLIRKMIRPSAVLSLACVGVGLGLAGCADSASSEPSMEQRQAEAMKDPFSYGPEVPTAGSRRSAPPVAEPPPKEDNIKSEWQRFWNP
ncbi:MAG: hypothetical protein JWM57_739 [Phycisphaerales bacterium]|nr:hypothetical protein [Phycisphaerales bacterium]